MRLPSRFATTLAVSCLFLASTARSWSDEGGWVDLMDLESWNSPVEGWKLAGSAGLDPKEPKALAVEPGTGVLHNGPSGKAKNLISKESFGDVELHVEFNVPKGSNSGVKFHTVYEVQIFDSFGSTKKPSGSDCGGVYPRSEQKPKYHAIDQGYPPLVNACKPPGEWQVLDIIFLAPRFDASGNKVDCARITAVLNGKKVQDNLEVHSGTGSAWRDPEKTTGPLLIQGDHGPVAYRNLKARRLPQKR
jgi:Domain of Unknown Function (DUF1080)